MSVHLQARQQSHLTRGAWIEIYLRCVIAPMIKVAPHTRCVDWNRYIISHCDGEISRTSHEVRGLKYFKQIINEKTNSRTSHEVRGLKFSTISMESRSLPSHLTRGAWIEITRQRKSKEEIQVAPHTRCVDWNILYIIIRCVLIGRTSHEVRGLK